MALDSNTTWGANIRAKITALGITDGTPVTNTDLDAIWSEVKMEDTSQLGKSDVAAGTFVDGMASPVTGVGGPVT